MCETRACISCQVDVFEGHYSFHLFNLPVSSPFQVPQLFLDTFISTPSMLCFSHRSLGSFLCSPVNSCEPQHPLSVGFPSALSPVLWVLSSYLKVAMSTSVTSVKRDSVADSTLSDGHSLFPSVPNKIPNYSLIPTF